MAENVNPDLLRRLQDAFPDVDELQLELVCADLVRLSTSAVAHLFGKDVDERLEKNEALLGGNIEAIELRLIEAFIEVLKNCREFREADGEYEDPG
jgi:hypothetical protein